MDQQIQIDSMIVYRECYGVFTNLTIPRMDYKKESDKVFQKIIKEVPLRTKFHYYDPTYNIFFPEKI